MPEMYTFCLIKDLLKYCLIFCLFVLIESPVIAQDAAENKILRIDPSNTISVTASLILNEVNYIPLETNKESLFGFISQLGVTNEYFIIRDPDTKSILFFYRNGKFHCKITRDNYSGGLFYLNREKREVSFRRGLDLWYYDFNGKKLREERPKYNAADYLFSKNRAAHALYQVNSKFYKDTIAHELFLTRENEKYAEYLPYNMKTAPVQSSDYLIERHDIFYETGCDTSAYYCRPYDYNIYELTVAGLFKPFSFVFPLANSLPSAFYTDTALTDKKIPFIQAHKELIYGVSFPYHIGDNLFFKINQWNATPDSYIYNLKSENLISVRDIRPDSLTFNLPITDLNDGVEFANHNFLTSDGKYVYSCLSSAVMFKFNDVNADLKTRYNETLKTYFSKRDRKDNPVIVQIKPKENF
jgi:hypothetical protein